ncbi:MAG: DUF5674 family protein [Bacteroidales bacterium]|nr:DUF5674 family protein [Bacteroidales bacterium]
MQIISEPALLKMVWENREVDFTEMMKIVVDIEREILAIDGDMHADLEKMLLESGSLLQNLWGANIYPSKENDEFLEFTSFINIRPSQENRGMEIKDTRIRAKISFIVQKLLK